MRGLPAGWYVDPARGPLEFSNVFGRSWQFVCHAADLPAPGTVARFDCAGRSAFVLRTRTLELRAFRNVCSHRGSRLIDGDRGTGLAFCVDGRVRCAYHGWAYDEEGRLESIPAGQRFDTAEAESLSLAPLPVAQWRGLVFVAFGTPERALEAALGEGARDWPDASSMRRLVEPRSIDVAADWKLACEHVLDTAHLRVTRPTPRSRIFEPSAFTVASPDALRATGAPVETTRASWPARAYLQLAGDSGAAADFLFLWPNLLLCLAGGTLTVAQVLPLQAGACRVRATRYGGSDSTREARRRRYLHERVLRRALQDDARLLERVQHGLGNLEATTALPIDDAQPGLHWFVERCRAALEPVAAKKPGTRTRRPRAAVVAAPP